MYRGQPDLDVLWASSVARMPAMVQQQPLHGSLLDSGDRTCSPHCQAGAYLSFKALLYLYRCSLTACRPQSGTSLPLLPDAVHDNLLPPLQAQPHSLQATARHPHIMIRLYLPA